MTKRSRRSAQKRAEQAQNRRKIAEPITTGDGITQFMGHDQMLEHPALVGTGFHARMMKVLHELATRGGERVLDMGICIDGAPLINQALADSQRTVLEGESRRKRSSIESFPIFAIVVEDPIRRTFCGYTTPVFGMTLVSSSIKRDLFTDTQPALRIELLARPTVIPHLEIDLLVRSLTYHFAAMPEVNVRNTVPLQWMEDRVAGLCHYGRADLLQTTFYDVVTAASGQEQKLRSYVNTAYDESVGVAVPTAA